MKDILTIVITSNRPNAEIIQVINKLPHIPDLPFTIVFITQGYKPQMTNSKTTCLSFSKSLGASTARNIGIAWAIQHLHPDIIACTDDDCQFSTEWIKQIRKFFLLNKHTDIVFGRTLPMNTHLHLNEYCPSTFTRKTAYSNKLQIPRHWLETGFSNNMAFRAKIIKRIGGFREWLGPGAIGANGEDAEFIIRATISGIRIGYNKHMTLEHNKWLNKSDMAAQSRLYTTGGLAAYIYHAARGCKDCWIIGAEHIYDSMNVIRSHLGVFITFGKLHQYSSAFQEILKEIYALILGITVSLWFSLWETNPRKAKAPQSVLLQMKKYRI